MAPETSSGGLSEDEARRRMLQAVADAIEKEDYDFSTQIAAQQNFLLPFEVAEYMDVKRRHAEDPVEKRRWEEALTSYLDFLAGIEFPPEEAEAIDEIIKRLEFDNVVESETVAKEQDEGETEDDNEDDDDENWEEDSFGIDMSVEEVKKIRQMPVFQHAESLAKSSSGSFADLRAAVYHIEGLVSGDLQGLMRKVLDWYVYKEAENHAMGSSGSFPNLYKANSIIEDYSSSEKTAAEIRAAIDKHVFNLAASHAHGTSGSFPDQRKAREIIEDYASRPGRRDAMLRRLGFM